MRNIRIDKVVLNIGIGSDDNLLPNAKALLKKLTNHEAATRSAKKRDPTLHLRKGQVISALVTLRGEEAREVLKKTLDANDNTLKPKAIMTNSLSFGIKEYIDISGVKYDPKIGMLGMHVNVSFSRPGKRVERRKRSESKIPSRHNLIDPKEIEEYMAKNFNAKIAE